MTIIFQGHVEKLEQGHLDGVRITVVCPASRMSEPLVIEAQKGEADIYKPGMQLTIRITPS